MRHFPLKGGLLSRTGRSRKCSNIFQKQSQWKQTNRLQPVSNQVCRRKICGRWRKEWFTWSDGTVSAREWKPCRVGNRHPSVGTLGYGKLRSSASRLWSGLFSRLQAAIMAPVSYMEDCDAPVSSFSCKRIDTSIRALPFDPKGLPLPHHWEFGFNIRTQQEHKYSIYSILTHRHTSME